MTDVYLAQDTRNNGRMTVLKIVEESNDPYTQQVLVAERRGAAIQKQLRDFDPRFVEIYEYGQMDGAFFVAMEYVEGRSVSDLLRESGCIEPQTAARIAMEICSQLEKLHSHQAEIDGRRRAIVHGDIKPSNVQIATNGQVRLLDFGIAKLISLTRNLTHHDLGSPNYCSPERLASAQVDQFADLWATGVTLYEMISGALPYQAESTRKLEAVIRSKRPPRELPADVPEPMAAIIRKSLAVDLKRRYQSASAFANDLECFLNNRQTVAAQEFKTSQSNPTVESIKVTDHVIRALESPWQTLMKVRVPRPANTRTILWIAAATGALLLVASGARGYRIRWVEAAPLRAHTSLEQLSTAQIEQDWNLYQKLRARDAFLGRLSPVQMASGKLETAYVADADRIIDSYRRSPDPSITDFDWPRAQTVLEHAQEIDPANTTVRGKLQLARGYVDLNLAMGPQMDLLLHMQDRIIRSFQEFNVAAVLLPKAPDPHLGLARLYVYPFRDLDKAIGEWNMAEERHYNLTAREMEQEADGFLFRAQDEITKKHDLKAGREDLKHAKQIYLTIQHYDDVPKRLHLVAMDERALNPPPPPKPVTTQPVTAKPAAKKPVSATSTRRAQAWQSPKAGKRKIK
jgi:tRNA A-37 threonylcarbamoyl transferase component Bud32